MTIAEFYKKHFRPGIISTDSRKIVNGSVFIALRGDHFNGNDFAVKALNSGASIAVVDETVEKSGEQILVVPNTLTFLQELAKYHRAKNKFNIIGLTGTNGKTTTKELIHSVLSEKFKVQSTQGNLNNHIGVPLTLLSIEPGIDYGIVEMGANHSGEIKTLCEIASPDSGLITNIGRAHLEGFGSFKGVVKAKSELYEFIKTHNGKLYCNGSDKILKELIGNYRNRTFYNSDDGICRGQTISSIPFLVVEIISNNNTVIVKTNLYGDYNLPNILASACVAIDHGLELDIVKTGIEKYKPSNFRSQILQIGSCHVILDCYNANPSSMELAIKNFANYKSKRKIVILGSMKELGKYSHHEHKKLAKFTEKFDFEKIILYGSEFENIKTRNSIYTHSYDELEVYLNSLDLHDTLILIKGSRANKLERLKALFESYQSSIN